MILSFDEIYASYEGYLKTRARFIDLICLAHQDIYGYPLCKDIDLLEDDLKLKIEVVRLIKEDNPLNYIQPDELNVFDTPLQLVVDDLQSSHSELDVYRCKKCKNVMTQAIELDCGCCVCIKCLIQHNKPEQCKHGNSGCCSTPFSVATPKTQQEPKCVRIGKTMTCPVCFEEISFAKQLPKIDAYTRKLKYFCKYKQCQYQGDYYEVLEHMKDCECGKQELETSIDYYKKLLHIKQEEIDKLHKQLNEQVQYLEAQDAELLISNCINQELRDDIDQNKRVIEDLKLQSQILESKLQESGISADALMSAVDTMHASIENANEYEMSSKSVPQQQFNQFQSAQMQTSNDLLDLDTADLEMEDKAQQTSIVQPYKNFQIQPILYNEVVEQQQTAQINQSGLLTISALENSKVKVQKGAPRQSNLLAQLRLENNALKDEVIRLKQQYRLGTNVHSIKRTNIEIIEFPKDFISTLDYDLTIITVMRYIFYSDEYEGNRLQNICQDLRNMLILGTDYNNSDYKAKYSYLLQFIGSFHYLYMKGCEANKVCKQLQSRMAQEFLKLEMEPDFPLARRVYNMMTRRQDNSVEFNKIDIGGYIMKNDFGIEARLVMLDYIQKLKVQLKQYQQRK